MTVPYWSEIFVLEMGLWLTLSRRVTDNTADALSTWLMKSWLRTSSPVRRKSGTGEAKGERTPSVVCREKISEWTQADQRRWSLSYPRDLTARRYGGREERGGWRT